jgi:hypothetical protein
MGSAPQKLTFRCQDLLPFQGVSHLYGSILALPLSMGCMRSGKHAPAARCGRDAAPRVVWRSPL